MSVTKDTLTALDHQHNLGIGGKTKHFIPNFLAYLKDIKPYLNLGKMAHSSEEKKFQSLYTPFKTNFLDE